MLNTKKGFKIQVGEEFKPDPEYKKILYIRNMQILPIIIIFGPIQLIMVLFILSFNQFATSYLFGLITIPNFTVPIILILILFLSLFTAIVIYSRAFYNSITYQITEDEVIWARGVWFRKTGVVPYPKITNVDVAQGPLSRRYGIGSVQIQTAGYSARARAEIIIDGRKDFQELSKLIMELAKKRKRKGVET